LKLFLYDNMQVMRRRDKISFIYYVVCVVAAIMIAASIIDVTVSARPKKQIPIPQPPKYDGIIKLLSGRERVLFRLPATEYYTIKITGDDLTYVDGSVITISAAGATWSFCHQIDLRFENVFAHNGTEFIINAVSLPGHITHLGINISMTGMEKIIHVGLRI
jgi:hypothetical protein